VAAGITLTPVLTLVVVAMVVGCRSSREPESAVAQLPDRPEARTETEQTAVARDYQFVGERNMFRPLVVAPKGEGGGAGSGGSSSAPRPTGAPSASQSRSGPPRPPDPTADLAITGITETTDGLRVLIEKISTREGQYAAVGDVIFGLTVQHIGRGSVTLTQGEKEYELKLGEKEMTPTSPGTPQTVGQSQTPTPAATASSSSSSTPSFGGRMDWRNMSPEERQRAMEERRRWWEGLSDSDRESYRSRGGRGSSGGPSGGSGRGPSRGSSRGR
jgi:hypothetical protein